MRLIKSYLLSIDVYCSNTVLHNKLVQQSLDYSMVYFGVKGVVLQY